MVLAWNGKTPTGHLLKAYICENCFATRYIGRVNDPVFQMIKEINKKFMKVWGKRLNL